MRPLSILIALTLGACATPPRGGGTTPSPEAPASPPSASATALDEARSAAAPDEASAEAALEVLRAEDEPGVPPGEKFLDDFPQVLRRGTLRVLVVSRDRSLPRDGAPVELERELVREFAARHGLKVQFVVAEGWDDLLPLLNDGRADLIASNLTVTPARAKEVAFTRPVAVVQELVVGRKGAPGLPHSVKELSGREVHVRRSSAFFDTLEQLARAKTPVKIVAAPEHLDSETLVYEVSRGKRPLTVADSHTVAAAQAYNDDVQVLFPIADGRQIAWAVRKQSVRTRTALDAFLIEKALTVHTVERFTGDLDGIKKRGVLRVLTRNNPVTYYLHRGQQYGFDYELARLLAKSLDVRLEMVVAPSRDLLIPWLLEGRGDLIAASFTATAERATQVTFSVPYLEVEEQLVQRSKGGPKLSRLEELRGKKVHVRRSSSYRETLEALQAQYGPFEIVDAPEDTETEDLIEAVGDGQLPFTVSDSHLLAVERGLRGDVEAAFSLPRPAGKAMAPIAFALRPESQALKAQVDRFVKRTYRGLEYNVARKRYFENVRRAERARTERTAGSGELSPYDAIIRKHASRYSLDWRLLAAQAYQESRFDPEATSWVGARGLFQVMPATGREMGFHRLDDPEEGSHAGIKYMHKLINQFEPTLPFRQRVRFALAAYNAGYGHVADARRLAAELGLNPDRWFENVERAMLLLQKPKYYRRARHGYCRGSEPVKYVSEIQNRYDNYVKLLATVEQGAPQARR